MAIRVKKDKSGHATPIASEYEIAANTVIKVGSLVKLSANKVVAASTTEATDILGIAAEPHGTADALNPRATGTKILVEDSPMAVFETEAPVITATGGSTTTIVSTDIDTGGTDDSFNGGYAKLIYKGASSANTDAIGTIYTITDYDASEDTLTINTAGGAVTAGDKFAIFPPRGFDDFSYTATLDGIVLSDDGQAALKVVGYDFEKETVELFAKLHFYANENA